MVYQRYKFNDRANGSEPPKEPKSDRRWIWAYVAAGIACWILFVLLSAIVK